MKTFILSIIHVSLLFGFIFAKTRKPFSAFLKERSKTVSDKLSEGKKAQLEVERRTKEVEAKFTSLNQTQQQLIQEWKNRTLEQIKEVQESSVRVREQAKKDAALNLDSLKQQAKHDARTQMMRKLLVLTETKVKQLLTEDVKNKINQNVIQQLEKSA